MKEEMSIKTPELFIKGNIMCWQKTIVQLSNVSCISTSPLEPLPFPKGILLFLIAGLAALNIYVTAALILLIVALFWTLIWCGECSERTSSTKLNIIMNSGNSLVLVIGNEEFAKTILQILQQIMIKGGVGEKNVKISIKDTTIMGNAEVLNNLTLNGGNEEIGIL